MVIPTKRQTSVIDAWSSGDASWLTPAFQSVAKASADPRMASAAALAIAAPRIVLTGSGPGADPAAFAATLFRELGFDATYAHSGDIRSGVRGLQPGDLVIGIDTDTTTVAAALRRARASGIRTLGVTTRELTLLDADTLLYIPAGPDRHRSPISTRFAMSLALASLAARLVPESPVAGSLGQIEQRLNRIMSGCGRLVASVLFGSTGNRRVVFAGQGAAAWAARSLTTQLNRVGLQSALPHAVVAAYQDVVDGWWRFDRSDTLVLIDPYKDASPLPRHASDDELHPHRTWRLQNRKPASQDDIQIPGNSPALASLIAFVAIASQIEFSRQHLSGVHSDDV